MTFVAEVVVPVEGFLLGEVVAEYGLTVRFRSHVPVGDALPPHLLVEEASDPDVTAALGGVDAVESVERVGPVSAGTLYRLRWNRVAEDWFAVFRGDDVVLDAAVGTPDRWTFGMFCERRAVLSRFRRECERVGIPYRLARLTDARREGASARLTPPQHRALEVAVERGYFEVPRGVTLAELGDELGVSRQAVANRLRRATKQLAADALGPR